MDSVRKILFLTGTRADFGKIKSLVREVQEADEFEYELFVTGMHLITRYGFTLHEIQKAGFDHIYPYINQDGSVDSQMDLVLANTVQGLGHFVREFRPDLLVVHGDRVEALAGAIVGALNNILVAHVEGGEVSGTVDELIRHAITKLSHLHFVANADARNRLVQMGEVPDSVFVIGSPEIDVMLSRDLPSIEEVKGRYEIPFDQYFIFAYHPVTTELARLQANATEVMLAVEESGQNFVCIYPNNDTGSEIILQELLRLEHNPHFRLIPSMRFEYFLSLLGAARGIVGNSSAGVREAPVYGVATVNVGTRQLNRHHHESIVNVPEERAAILHAIRNLPRSAPPSLYFGRGDSAKRFIAELRRDALWQVPRQKQFRDLSLAVAHAQVVDA